MRETPDSYYDAALICITVICDRCGAMLDPDRNLGPTVNFNSDGWFIMLADEAYRCGWVIDTSSEVIKVECPVCANLSK